MRYTKPKKGVRPLFPHMNRRVAATTDRIPYDKPQPRDMRADQVILDALPRDERLWVPIEEHAWVRPLQFNVTQGQYTHIMRVTRAGTIAREIGRAHV